MKRIRIICALFAALLLLTGCAAPTAQDALTQPQQAAVTVAPQQTDMTGLTACLSDISQNYFPGTAGCSLRSARMAAVLLDWNALNNPAPDAIIKTAQAFASSLQGEAAQMLPEQLSDVYNAADALLQPDAADLLESAGYAPQAFPWTEEDVRTVFTNLFAGAGIPMPEAQPDGASDTFLPLDAAQPFMMDFEGDGVMETVTVVTNEDAYTTDVTVQAGDKTYTQHLDVFLSFLTAHAAKLVADDAQSELLLCGDEASDDYATYFFRLTDGQLLYTQLYGMVTDAKGDGLVTVNEVADVLGTYEATTQYARGADGTFTHVAPLTILHVDYPWAQSIVLKRDGLPVTAEASGESMTLASGTELLLIETDESSYALLEARDGARYRVSIARMEDDWQWYIGGVAETEWLVELRYAG